MAIHVYIVHSPEQLMALYELRRDGNRMMENLARVWRAQRVLASANYRNPEPVDWARVEIDTAERKARVYKRFGRAESQIGMLPYGRALAYCKEHLTRTKP